MRSARRGRHYWCGSLTLVFAIWCRMILVHGGLLGGFAVLAGCLVSGLDEPGWAGIAASFTVAGGAGHDHTRWLAHDSRISPATSRYAAAIPGLPLGAAQGREVPLTAR